MEAIEKAATGVGLPVTWMIGNAMYLEQNATYYNRVHVANGDDVELEDNAGLYALARRSLPWYTPAVSVEGAGHERNIASTVALGDGGFWGITWNSHGTDNTSDEGFPWGTYCADPTSYKRPSPAGLCRLLSFEWTARDLTRAYFANTLSSGYSAEAAFSTDPDDILLRAGFGTADGAAYEAALVDAYAAAGESMPLVMMSQQESAEQASRGNPDDIVLTALYAEAKRIGMRTMTLRQGAAVASAFSYQPRAIAFPYISGGIVTSSNGAPFTPATIDYHDNQAGMTFLSGHTLPDRVFEYAQDPVYAFNRPLVATYPGDSAYPSLRNITFAGGRLLLTFNASSATHFAVAFWTDPSLLAVSAPNVVAAGRAGFVASFDLPVGASVQSIACGRCNSTTFAYSH